MYTRHDEVPVFEYRDGQVDAAHYNHVQVALNRLGSELRLQLPGLKHLHLVLQRNAWIIVDIAFNDLPIAAWDQFRSGGRESLHQPIPCRLRLYHGSAGMVLRKSLAIMDDILNERLLEGQETHSVLPFRKGEPPAE